jgi:hypothetical protein
MHNKIMVVILISICNNIWHMKNYAYHVFIAILFLFPIKTEHQGLLNGRNKPHILEYGLDCNQMDSAMYFLSSNSPSSLKQGN